MRKIKPNLPNSVINIRKSNEIIQMQNSKYISLGKIMVLFIYGYILGLDFGFAEY